MKVEIVDKVATLYPEGRIDISNSTEFKNSVTSLIDQGIFTIYLDFSDVSGIDSSGLGKMLLFQKMLKEKGGELAVRNVKSDYVKKIFTLVQLYKVIDIEGLPEE
ncbi:STAS domain-containing protein [Desulforamulus ferrireducens]|uniref:Anti-anti-sigma factor n=1 Tax=Desulforamulus ferrireducens TaxID=1833852 RepID=A0A1S6IUW8_9FIRM|nr:STAS domain-containing protein [Desulforamulus ferrireducens]AQS58566.1 anti-anti-sigma factor [Desulforamulus ferrireducens]